VLAQLAESSKQQIEELFRSEFVDRVAPVAGLLANTPADSLESEMTQALVSSVRTLEQLYQTHGIFSTPDRVSLPDVAVSLRANITDLFRLDDAIRLPIPEYYFFCGVCDTQRVTSQVLTLDVPLRPTQLRGNGFVSRVFGRLALAPLRLEDATADAK
jgi:hypothetical protein